MTLHLPEELESSVEAVLHGGCFASADEVMAEAARMLLRACQQPSTFTRLATPHDPVLGPIEAMADNAELLDGIVAEAYRRRTLAD